MARTPWRIHLWAWDLAEMLQFIMWNGEKIWTKKIWIKKKIELKKIWKFFFSVRTYVKPNLVFSKISFMLGGGGQKIKVAQNGMKHGLVLEFLRSDEIFEICGGGGGGGGRGNKTKMFLSSSWVQIWKNSLF